MLRTKVPDLVLSADVMVGFPTESDKAFQDTLQMVEDLDIAYPHVFSYSERSGTPAARIPASKQVPAATRKLRNQQLRRLGEKIEQDLLQRKLGSQVWVLPEYHEQDGWVRCRGEDYVPTFLDSNQVKTGQWVRASITELQDGKLYGKVLTS